MSEIQVVGICGSLRDGSYTRMALQVALAGAIEKGAKTTLIDLRDYDLVFCNGSKNPTQLPPDVHKLRAQVKAAQGIILGTPEYHGSFSGVLKNALDLMGFNEFEGKMMGLLAVSGGSMGGFNALNSLRSVGRALHAWIVPQQVAIPHAYKVFNADGTLSDDNYERRLKEIGHQVARFAYLHSSSAAREFLEAWESAPENPGGDPA